ncbi:11576_t:CDS:1, partial [Diversispora eburnea]
TENEINSNEWKDAIFLVRRNDLQVQINFDVTIEHAKNYDQLIHYVITEDLYKNKPVHGNIQQKFLSVSDTKSNTLCGILPLSIRMKITLTTNICTNDGM